MASKSKNPFQDYLAGKRSGIKVARDASKSTEWLRNQVVKLGHGQMRIKQAPTSKQANRLNDPHTNTLRLGNMYFFVYDPKHKKTLAYYDKFPLVFPVRYYSDGMLCFNLHYLPPHLRVVVLDQIYAIISDRGISDIKKYRLTASMIQALSTIPQLKPCLKRYLSAHVRSLFMPVSPEEWEHTVLLDSSNFEKASKSKVWADSMAMIG